MSILLHLMAQTMQPPAGTGYAGNSFTLTSGNDDPKTPLNFGYSRGSYGSISDTSQFLDMYGENTHQVDALTYNSPGASTTFLITGTASVSNSGWTSITYSNPSGTTTLYRSDATFSQPSGSSSGRWVWTSSDGATTVASGTVTLA